MNKISWCILHHTGGIANDPFYDSSNFTLENINNAHRAAGYPKSSMGLYVGYTYVILKSGEIKQARKVGEEGAHTKGMNKNSVGICLCGNFSRPANQPNSYPTEVQIKSLKSLLDEITDRYGIDGKRIVPHRFFNATDCYGNNLADDWGKLLFIRVLKNKIGLYEQLIKLYVQLKNMLFKGQQYN